MLDDQDLKKIGNLIEEKVGPLIDTKVGPIIDSKLKASEERIIGAVGEMIEQNVLPLIANLPDKAYLDEKLGNSEGKIIAREKKMDYKVNRLVEIQHTRKLLSDEEVGELNAIQIFPSAPAVM